MPGDLLDNIIICGNDDRTARDLTWQFAWDELAEIERARVIGFWRTLRDCGSTDLDWRTCSGQGRHVYVKCVDGMCGCGQVPRRLLSPLTCDCGGSRLDSPESSIK